MDETVIYEILAGRKALQIEVYNDAGAKMGHLSPLSSASLDDKDLIDRLTRWRNDAREHFFSQRILSREETEAWMRDCLLNDPHRLLFVIHAGEKAVGTIGFALLQDRSAELGNLIRGEPGGGFTLMQRAHSALLDWLFRNIDIDIAIAMVFADNTVAVNHLRLLGLQPIERVQMHRTEEGPAVTYQVEPLLAPGAVMRDALKMGMRREDWLRQREKGPLKARPSWYAHARAAGV